MSDEAAVWNPMEQQFVAPCRHCGTPKRIDAWCASPECAERVAQAQEFTPPTRTLADFLLARITEDETVARRGHGMTDGLGAIDLDEYADVLVIDPARVLAECEAKRRIVEMVGAEGAYAGEEYRLGFQASHDLLRLLALPYADHPDFREEWRP